MTKPIATEYWGEWISHPTSTIPEETRVRWRVVEIVKMHEFGTYGRLIDAERIEAIESQSRVVSNEHLTDSKDN